MRKENGLLRAPPSQRHEVKGEPDTFVIASGLIRMTAGRLFQVEEELIADAIGDERRAYRYRPFLLRAVSCFRPGFRSVR